MVCEDCGRWQRPRLCPDCEDGYCEVLEIHTFGFELCRTKAKEKEPFRGRKDNE